MSFMNDLKKFAIARLKERRHRQTRHAASNSLPPELKKDIGWTGAEPPLRIDASWQN